LLEFLHEEEHVEILEDNLKEENGIYEQETLQALEVDFDVSRSLVDGIPHSDLYQSMIQVIEKKLNKSFRDSVPDEIVLPMKKAISDLRMNGHGLMALLYFGSEYLVPQLYTILLQGLSSSMNLSNNEMAFLVIHTGVDEEHAKEMRKVILYYSKSQEDRSALVHYTETFLQARVTFLDSITMHSPFTR
jgi:hypothetical protein